MRCICIGMGLLLSGCGLASGEDGGVDTTIRALFTPADDVVFADAMIAHHHMALDMAEEEIARGEDAAVVALAVKIRTAQTAEVATLETLRNDLSDAPETPMEDDPQRMTEMAELTGASGEELDRLFLVDMIAHHAEAVTMSHRALPNLEDETLADVATAIFQAQANEIGAMAAMLDDHEVPPHGD